MSRMLCACGAPLEDGSGFCRPCRESLGLAPLPKPVVSHVWTEDERRAFRERAAKAYDLQRRIAALPDPVVDDPFVGVNGGPLSLGMANGGGKR